MLASSTYAWAYRQVRTTPWIGRTVLRCIPNWQVKVQLDFIGPFYIQLRRHRSFWLRHPFCREAFCIGALRRFVRPGDVAYDVGSNIGLLVRFMAGPLRAGCVVGFEPAPDNLKMLDRNIRAGNIFDRVRVLPVALGDRDGEQEFQLDDVSSASGCLNSVSNGEASEARRQYGFRPLTQNVRVASLDSLIDRERLPAPAVIKIDIEGGEGAMLRGARQTLEALKPKLVIELHGLSRAVEVADILSDAGYYAFGYVRTGDQLVYKQVLPRDARALKDRYDLEFLAASTELNDVQQPIDLTGYREG